jgi:hypothetical protein
LADAWNQQCALRPKDLIIRPYQPYLECINWIPIQKECQIWVFSNFNKLRGNGRFATDEECKQNLQITPQKAHNASTGEPL